jgi:hypothetical protein
MRVKVGRSGLGSCQIAGFGTSSVERSGSTTSELVRNCIPNGGKRLVLEREMFKQNLQY